ETSLSIKAKGEIPFCFTCHHYTVDDLDKATHIHKLEEKDFTEVCLDVMQRGVGGDAPGNACLRDPYIMHKGTSYSLKLRLDFVSE
ncbi:MAG: hypothetical protein IJ262_10685, partial [Clostridia bacterium]|nr:hypothetical protein [Clostridia bacterium]